MPDVKKVIKGLECCIIRHPDDKARCDECPYESAYCNRLKMDALSLLKAQEPIAPKPTTDDDWMCGNCANGLVGYTKLEVDGVNIYRFSYCPNCGRAVKWNG